MSDTDQDDRMKQSDVFLKALEIHVGRSEAYGEVWRNYGALSNLLSAARKVDRLMELWWHAGVFPEMPAIHKDALDDAFDAINYLAFFIRNATEGNLTGTNHPNHDDVGEPCDYCKTKGREWTPECEKNK